MAFTEAKIKQFKLELIESIWYVSNCGINNSKQKRWVILTKKNLKHGYSFSWEVFWVSISNLKKNVI